MHAAVSLCASDALSKASIGRPTRAVRLIVPFAPGQGSDVLARALAASLAAIWKTAVVVDNRPGANGTLAVQELLRAPADGHHLLVSSNSPIVINPSLYRRLPYRPEVDLLPLALLARTDVALVVSRALNLASFAQLADRLRVEPASFSYASPGVGSTAHMYLLLLSRALGVELTHVPYKGSSAAMNDLLSARVQLMFDGLPSCMPHVRSGHLRALAVAGSLQSSFLPDVPDLASLGVRGLPGQGWYGAFARAQTPQPMADQLRADLQRVAAAHDFHAQLRTSYLEPPAAHESPTDALRAVVQQELAQWERLTTSLNLHRTE